MLYSDFLLTVQIVASWLPNIPQTSRDITHFPFDITQTWFGNTVGHSGFLFHVASRMFLVTSHKFLVISHMFLKTSHKLHVTSHKFFHLNKASREIIHHMTWHHSGSKYVNWHHNGSSTVTCHHSGSTYVAGNIPTLPSHSPSHQPSSCLSWMLMTSPYLKCDIDRCKDGG